LLKRRIPLALLCAAAASFVLLYLLGTFQEGKGSSVGMANLAGLLLVLCGIVAAGLILRRASPPT